MLLSLAAAFGLATAPQDPALVVEEPRGLRVATSQASAGFTLISPLGSRHTHLVDLRGREVHRWTSELGTSRLAPSAAHLLDDGSILCCGRTALDDARPGHGLCGRVERIAWDGTLLWRYELADRE